MYRMNKNELDSLRDKWGGLGVLRTDEEKNLIDEVAACWAERDEVKDLVLKYYNSHFISPHSDFHDIMRALFPHGGYEK